MFALRGGDDVLVLGTEGLCLCAAPAVTVEIFQASSWICSFPLPAATRARTAEHRTLLWKRKKKKRIPLRFVFCQERMDLQPSGHGPAFQTQPPSSGRMLISEVRHV